MILDPKQTTVAYRCPKCGAGTMSVVGLFNLRADMIKLKCDCGGSEMSLVYGKDTKVRFTVPCLFCPNPHYFTVDSAVFFSKDLFALSCPYSGVNVALMGETNRVKAELSRGELELLDLLEENGISSFEALHGEQTVSDPQIMEIVTFVIHDLDAEGKIYCKCHPEGSEPKEDEDTFNLAAAYDGDYAAELTAEGLRVYCKKCGSEKIIPTNSLISAHDFLNCDSITLE